MGELLDWDYCFYMGYHVIGYFCVGFFGYVILMLNIQEIYWMNILFFDGSLILSYKVQQDILISESGLDYCTSGNICARLISH